LRNQFGNFDIRGVNSILALLAVKFMLHYLHIIVNQMKVKCELQLYQFYVQWNWL